MRRILLACLVLVSLSACQTKPPRDPMTSDPATMDRGNHEVPEGAFGPSRVTDDSIKPPKLDDDMQPSMFGTP